MAVAYRGGGGRAELQRQYWKERGSSPERTLVWTEPRSSMEKKVEVVYYLTRNNGHLDHPHFMELSLPSGQPLYLRDVMRRLNSLRGAGMASMYSWSCKRSYNNGGFVWQDLSPHDLIYPARAHGYVLKGSQLLLCPLQHHKPLMEDISHNAKEYRVHRSTSEPTAESHIRSVDVGTQTDEGRKPRDEETEIAVSPPPPSSSSNETMEGGAADEDEDPEAAGSGKMRAPAAVLMHLFSCGSMSMKGQGTTSLVSHLRRGRPVATSRVNSNTTTNHQGDLKGNYSFSGTSRLEAMEYFSGSLIEMKKNKGSNGRGEAHPGLRRSASYNADRSLKLEVAKEMDGVRARCIPTRPKANGSKRITDDQ